MKCSIVLWLSVLGLLAAQEPPTGKQIEWVTLVSKSGSRLQTCPLSIDKSQITFMRASDKKEFSIPIGQLEESSVAAARKWIEEGKNRSTNFKVNLTAKFGSTLKQVDTSPRVPGTSRDLIQTSKSWIDLKVSFSNLSPNAVTPKALARFYTMMMKDKTTGRGKTHYVVKSANQHIIPPLKPLQRHFKDFGRLELAHKGYGPTYKGGYGSGGRISDQYDGYIMVIFAYGSSEILTVLSDIKELKLNQQEKLINLSRGDSYSE